MINAIKIKTDMRRVIKSLQKIMDHFGHYFILMLSFFENSAHAIPDILAVCWDKLQEKFFFI